MPKNHNMFNTTITTLSPTVKQYKIYQKDKQLTYAQVLDLWKTSADFRTFYNNLLAESSFEAYFWENPSITTSTVSQLYEFVLVNSSALIGIKPSQQAFSTFFNKPQNGVVTFENLGKNALLVVPSPIVDDSAYPHISAFVRNAPIAQYQIFWQQVGHSIQQRLSTKKLWISTSGLGVYWLHVRLDNRPKYYQYRPYRNS